MKVLNLLFLLLFTANAYAGILKGKITDKDTKEPLIGASVVIKGTQMGAATNVDGYYEIKVPNGTYEVVVNYIGYRAFTSKNIVIKGDVVLDVALENDTRTLKSLVVVGEAKRNSELSQISVQRTSLLVQSGVSAQLIKKTQDKDASEVIRRVPGVSIINDKFVMVRGLSQRYNNVWINGGAVPSSEPDTRAFSFDLLPSSQIDNISVIKSPAPEYPADFTGGFIIIDTKDIPSKDSFSLSLGTGINTQTQFHDFLYSKGSSTDFLGFDSGLRSLSHGIETIFQPMPGKVDSPDQKHIDLRTSGFNNDWLVKHKKPMFNGNFGIEFSKHKEFGNGKRFGVVGALNCSNGYTRYVDMDNNFFGVYNTTLDKSNYMRKAKDDRYAQNVRIGSMLNFSLVTDNHSRYEFKNIFNQLGNDRYTYRRGIDAQNNYFESAEYYYSSRSAYNGQLTGKYDNENNHFDWSAGYAYSGKKMPDRRRYMISDQLETGKLGVSNSNDINREYTDLNEHMISLNTNYEHKFKVNEDKFITMKTGVFGVYRTRTYRTRDFFYNWEGINSLPKGFQYLDVTTELLNDRNYGPDKIYLLEKPGWTNNYDADDKHLACYLAANIPIGPVNVYAGVRFEHDNMTLTKNTRDEEKSGYDIPYHYDNFFPSINSIYKINKANQLRLSYGRTVNRPEFREVSPSVFYDFELGSNVQGYYNLKPAFADNIDFRYECYPKMGEMLSVALFYKNFKNPIEWTYTMTGGTDPVYSFQNAKRAYSLGVELDVRKNLDFIKLPMFSLSLNASLIKSKVEFDKSSHERTRPMQGQSPYLVNAGLFYRNDKMDFNIGLLYNCIGKRIVGVGRTVGTSGESTVNIPDSYEMPRNVLDLNVSKMFAKRFLLKLSLRDILAEKINFKQFNDVTMPDGRKKEVVEVAKSFRPGRTINLSLTYNF